jgi:hypothetical protein
LISLGFPDPGKPNFFLFWEKEFWIMMPGSAQFTGGDNAVFLYRASYPDLDDQAEMSRLREGAGQGAKSGGLFLPVQTLWQELRGQASRAIPV